MLLTNLSQNCISQELLVSVAVVSDRSYKHGKTLELNMLCLVMQGFNTQQETCHE